MPEDDDKSIVNSVRREVLGPTDEERAETLSEKADNDPAAITTDDINELAEMLTTEDSEVVRSALAALDAIVADRPSSVAELAPRVAELLSARPEEEWKGTTLGEMDDEFLIDMMAGGFLVTLAKDDPAHLQPIVSSLTATMKEEDGRLEPHTWFALAHVAASDTADIDVDDAAFVDGICRTVRSQVDNESDDLSITVSPADEGVELLGAFGDPAAIETLQYARDETDDVDLATAASEAIDAIEAEI